LGWAFWGGWREKPILVAVSLPSTVLDMADASYPNFADKHAGEAIFSPGDVVAGLEEDRGLIAPDAVILTYQRSLLEELAARGVHPTGGYPGLWRSRAGRA
jgi:hypothetical protein